MGNKIVLHSASIVNVVFYQNIGGNIFRISGVQTISETDSIGIDGTNEFIVIFVPIGFTLISGTDGAPLFTNIEVNGSKGFRIPKGTYTIRLISDSAEENARILQHTNPTARFLHGVMGRFPDTIQL